MWRPPQRWCGIAALTLAACGVGGVEGEGPRIDSIEPAAAAAGATVILGGVRFCGDDAADVQADGSCTAPPAGVVIMGGARATVSMWTDRAIAVVVPAVGPGEVEVTVTRDEAMSNVFSFTVQ